ncbi:UreE urease accessory, N-terminal [Pseudooceanicola batsensis HTCC2597]|uniref:UreE urease accessory, N-terminal n=1 Tax=Pseudooceanicola batsensis (strain ATCC BAA-863 / DSM 15984 / KCTC 12145 / HTCC2597) TaxID=252305 RepID=A3U2Y8_PSEBH|nr:urease accessory protein UreE [Pseudooceanicola batsensis]EAQ01518.1 UreE urease accessory, N-terminal [Pseudooceanicola batsensis HTCC2597]
MQIYSDILGPVADFHDALHRLEHAHAVDVLRLPRADLARRRLRTRSEGGAEVALALPRDKHLYDGAVLAISEEAALVVRVESETWIRLATRDQATALRLGYFCGNLHWRVRFDGDVLLIAVDTEERLYHERLAPMIDAGEVILLPSGTEVSA